MAFSLSRMNISNLVAKVARKDVIANIIWKEGLESNGLAGQIGIILNETPIQSKESVKLLIALAAASKKSADEVFETQEDLVEVEKFKFTKSDNSFRFNFSSNN